MRDLFYGLVLVFFLGIIAITIKTFSDTSKHEQKISQEEISQEKYQQLMHFSLKYPSFGHLIHHSLRDDGKISNKEFDYLNDIYMKLSINDHINLYLQEKILEKRKGDKNGESNTRNDDCPDED